MSSTDASAPKRSRASAEQLSRLLDFFSESPGLASGKFQKLHGKMEYDNKWKEIAAHLNNLGGAVKTVQQWHTVWRDLKSRASIKVRDRKKQQALTGNRPINQEPITEIEKRIVALIGNEYIQGHESVAENVPMKEEYQLLLEDGEENVVFQRGSTANTSEDSMELRFEIPKTPTNRTRRRSLKRKRVEEDSETQAKFVEIAKQQADALKMLAECSVANVEANKMMAEAIKILGEGLKANAEAFNKLTNAINNLI